MVKHIYRVISAAVCDLSDINYSRTGKCKMAVD